MTDSTAQHASSDRSARGARARFTATHATANPATVTGRPMRKRRCPPTQEPTATSRNDISAACDAADVRAGMVVSVLRFRERKQPSDRTSYPDDVQPAQQ